MTALESGNRGLHARVLTLIAVGVLAPLVALSVASWISLGSLREQVATDRRLLAAGFADHVDDALRTNQQLLQEVASAPRVDPDDQDDAPERAALHAAVLHAHMMRTIFVVDATARVVAWEPATEAPLPLAAGDVAALRAAIQADRPGVGNLVRAGTRRAVLVTVPIAGPRGRTAGLVVGEVDPDAAGFADLVQLLRRRSGGRADLVDGEGIILATTQSGQTFTRSPDAEAVEAALAAVAGGARGDATRAFRAGDWEVALAPLSRAPWAIVTRERLGEGASVLTTFGRRLVWLGLLLIGLGAVFAWGAARSVVRPVVALTRAAERIGAGDLSEPIPSFGADEIGRLAKALERMRQTIERSLAEIDFANSMLERRVDERTRELADANRELKRREHWRGQLLNRVIAAQEDERKRIARELHDETSQTLSVLAMSLETASAALDAGPTRERLTEANALTVRALEELHRLIYDLRPSILDDLGLIPAIRWFADRHLTPLGITVRCECADLERRLPLELAVALFRVVQEAITNIEKHAGAETVLLQCAPVDGRLVIEIEDDGCGFDPAEVSVSGESARGLGLAGMRERVELIGGSLKIDSAPGRGVHVTVSVPLPGEARHG